MQPVLQGASPTVAVSAVDGGHHAVMPHQLQCSTATALRTALAPGKAWTTSSPSALQQLLGSCTGGVLRHAGYTLFAHHAAGAEPAPAPGGQPSGIRLRGVPCARPLVVPTATTAASRLASATLNLPTSHSQLCRLACSPDTHMCQLAVGLLLLHRTCGAAVQVIVVPQGFLVRDAGLGVLRRLPLAITPYTQSFMQGIFRVRCDCYCQDG
jgi:hypothetical protein